jgi:MFS family permease
MARRSYRLDLTSTFFFAFALACVEGGVASVFVKQTFRDVVGLGLLNLAVGIVSSAPDFANIISFIWMPASRGRAKVPFINALQLGLIGSVACMGAASRDGFGLVMVVLLALLARVCWSGIVTLRPTIWRANYERQYRASVVSKISTAQVIVVAAIGIAFGRLLDHEQGAFRWFFPTAAALALLAVWAFAKMRVRRSESLLRAERANTAAPMTPWGGLLAVRTVLRRDPLFARFMLWMFILGFGNLMMPPMLAIALSDQFGFKYLKSILITSAIPALVTIIAMPLWARFLDRAHVVRFRTIHSWAFVGAQGTMFLACWLHNERLLYVGAVLQGIGLGGGNLAWNLGHVDFAPPSETSQYMATHVTLNGLRGLLAPTAAVGLYHLCAASSLVPESLHAAPALLPLLLSSVFCVLGAVGFIQLRRSMGALAERANRAH